MPGLVIIRLEFFWLSVFVGQPIKALRAGIKRQPNKNFTHKQAPIKVWSRSLTGLTRLHIAKGIILQKASDVKIMSTLRTFAEHILQTKPNPVGETEHLLKIHGAEFDSGSKLTCFTRVSASVVVLRTGRHHHGCLFSLSRPACLFV